MRGGRWRWWTGQGSQRERSTHACMVTTMGWNEAHTQTSWAWAIVRCARDECDNTELTTKTVTTTRTLTCSCCASCWFSGSWFSRCHWCRTPQRPARWFHSSTAFHNAYATPSAKFFPSGCCSPTVSCHRPLNLYPKFLHISHRESGSFEVLSSHPPSVTVDRRQL